MREIGEDEATGRDTDAEYEARENLWDEQWPTTSTEGESHPEEETDTQDELAGFPDTVGTSDPIEASRDAEPYIAPIDPPTLPGGVEAIHTATGFGESTQEEMAEGGPYRNDADLQEEAELMLRQDSLTSHYTLMPETNDRVITIRGVVSDIDDAEHALSIVGEIPGVLDVVDEMTIDPSAT